MSLILIICFAYPDGKVPVYSHALAVATLGEARVCGYPAMVRSLPSKGEGGHFCTTVLIIILAIPEI